MAETLAGSTSHSVLIEGDAFFRFLASGAIEPWMPESNEQNTVVTQAAASAAGAFAGGGYATVYDGVVGPWFLPTFGAATGLDQFDYAVLLPSVEVCVRRVASRRGQGFTDEAATRKMHAEFAVAVVADRHVLHGPPEDITAVAALIASAREAGEPTQAARGRKHRAKTDRSDARLLRELLAAGELPASWTPPEGVLEWRERVRLYVSLVNQRTVWCQRIHAELYQHGVAVPEGAIRTAATRSMLADGDLALSPAGRQRITVAYRMIDATDAEALPLKTDLQRFGARQPACRALADAQYGIGGLIAVAVWSELGDCRRFSRSQQAVRHTGLDVSVDSSDRRRAGGFLSRQGPQTLRWALYEAAKNSSHLRSPDHDFYATVKARHDGKIAAISVARKLARRCYHVLREVDPDLVYTIPA